MQRVPRPRRDGNAAQSVSATHPLPTGQQTPLPQHTKSGAQVARKGTQLPPSQRTPSHGSSPAVMQSVSNWQLPPSSTGQQEPLPQQAWPEMQSTMKYVQNPSSHVAPVQASASPSTHSASCEHVAGPGISCAAESCPTRCHQAIQEPIPTNRSARRRFVRAAQDRAMRSNCRSSTLVHLPTSHVLPPATVEESGAFRRERLQEDAVPAVSAVSTA